MNFKHVLKIVFINILGIFLVFIILDWLLLAQMNYKGIEPPSTKWALTVFDRFEQPLPYIENKKPIAILGCSFAYGTDINQQDTLAYKLQAMTGRKVYNYSTPAQGLQYVLYKIQHSSFFDKSSPSMDYVIYVFMEDHTRRMYKTFRVFEDKYEYLKYLPDKSNKEFPLKTNVKDKIGLIDYIRETQVIKRIEEMFVWLIPDSKKFDFLKLHLLCANKILKKKHPTTQMVVIVCNSKAYLKNHKENSFLKPFRTSRWHELEKEGIKVINFDTPQYDFLSQPEYNTKSDTYSSHPSGLTWDVVAPVVIKELKLL
ncbi:hypothetical protein IJ670_01785 [bacterium]|nr:hypothetical protein [bacterium]